MIEVYDKIRVGKIFIDALTSSQLFEQFDLIVKNKIFSYVCFCDSNLYALAATDKEICEILKNASLVLPDGISIKLASNLIGKKMTYRLPGPKIMLEYCQHTVENRFKHYLYGAGPGVAEKLASNLRDKIHGINIVGTYTPPFRPLTSQEEVDIKNKIEQSDADILWVGLGAPKQEKWMSEHIGKINVPLMLGVGAAFDFHSGDRKWAPLWIRKIGFEWLYRMFTGGKRVFCRNFKCVILSFLLISKDILWSHLKKNN